MANYTASVVRRFESPGPQPNGLQAADDGLWCIDQVNLKAHKLDWDTGSVLHEIDTETEHSSGITLGDDAMWIASTFQLEIVKIDPDTGQTLARFPDPGAGLTSGRELTGDSGCRIRRREPCCAWIQRTVGSTMSSASPNPTRCTV